MENQETKSKGKDILLGIVGILAIGSLILIGKRVMPIKDVLTPVVVMAATVEDVYPLFMCPCCGKPIDTACCGMANERKAYVEGLVAAEISEDNVISVYVKKYGLSSFIDETRKKEFRDELIAQAPIERPIITLETQDYDFGDVSQDGGVVTAFFELNNDGKNDLIINKLETSCGCTSASIVYNGEEGPVFSMPGHGINEDVPADWQVTIKEGEKAQVKVYYDPDVHPGFRGTAIREVHIFSNDPIDFEKKIKVELNQVD